MTENRLQGKICLVTGSTSGIGKVTARELANRGATVVLVSRSRAKGEAKQALLLWTYELARRLEGTGVTVNALHPGVTASNFAAGMIGPAAWAMKLLKPFLLTVEQGAQTTLYLATSPQVEGVTGKYFVKSQEKPSSSRSYDQTVGSRLWEVTEQLVAPSAQQT